MTRDERIFVDTFKALPERDRLDLLELLRQLVRAQNDTPADGSAERQKVGA